MKTGMTLDSLYAELCRQEAAKEDYIVDTRRIHFVTRTLTDGDLPHRSEIDLLSPEGPPDGLLVLPRCHEQLGGYLKIPRRFYDMLRVEMPSLLDENVNRLLRHKPEPRMIRTLDGRARAFLSDRYRRFDNAPLARHVLPVLKDLGDDARVISCDLTESRMYLKVVVPSVAGEVKVGEEVCAGVFISNSEIGDGRLEVYPFVHTLACSNGMVVKKELGGVHLSKVHLGRRLGADEASLRVFSDETLQADDHAFYMAAADMVRAAVDQVRFRELIEVMKAAAESTPVENPVAAVRLLSNNVGLDDGEMDDVLRHLSVGGDLSRWGVLSAVTRTAEDLESYDRATELETIGGDMLAMSAREWRPYVEASS